MVGLQTPATAQRVMSKLRLRPAGNGGSMSGVWYSHLHGRSAAGRLELTAEGAGVYSHIKFTRSKQMKVTLSVILSVLFTLIVGCQQQQSSQPMDMSEMMKPPP